MWQKESAKCFETQWISCTNQFEGSFFSLWK